MNNIWHTYFQVCTNEVLHGLNQLKDVAKVNDNHQHILNIIWLLSPGDEKYMVTEILL